MPDETATTNETKPKMTIKKPAVFKKSCYYFWICDCSESMGLKNKSNNLVKMDEINKAIPEAIEKIRDFSKATTKGQITMRTLKFSDHAEWVDKDSFPVDQYSWKSLPADGATALGDAFSKLAQALKPINEGGTMPPSAYPPVLVLITDGYPTDDWTKGFEELMDQFWAKEAVRIAIGLEGADESILKAFIGEDVEDADKKMVKISNADLSQLADSITLVTTVYGTPSDKKKRAVDTKPIVPPVEPPVTPPVVPPVEPPVVTPDTTPETPPVTNDEKVVDGDVGESPDVTLPDNQPHDAEKAPEEKEPEPSRKEDNPSLHEEIIF